MTKLEILLCSFAHELLDTSIMGFEGQKEMRNKKYFSIHCVDYLLIERIYVLADTKSLLEVMLNKYQIYFSFRWIEF